MMRVVVGRRMVVVCLPARLAGADAGVVIGEVDTRRFHLRMLQIPSGRAIANGARLRSVFCRRRLEAVGSRLLLAVRCRVGRMSSGRACRIGLWVGWWRMGRGRVWLVMGLVAAVGEESRELVGRNRKDLRRRVGGGSYCCLDLGLGRGVVGNRMMAERRGRGSSEALSGCRTRPL